MVLDMKDVETRDLIIMPEYRWGGAETQFRAYIDYAQEQGFKTDVIITHGFGDYKAEIPSGKYSNICFYEIFNSIEFADYLSKRSLDVRFNVCLIYFPSDLRFFDILSNYGIKVVYSERNDGSEILNNAYYFDVLKKCNAVTSNSEYAAKRLKSKLGRKVIVINNGIEEKTLLEIRDNHKISNVLVPARIDRIKNQMSILRFLNKDNEHLHVTFAGRIQNKPYYLKMKHFIEDNGLDDYVLFSGDVRNMDMLYDSSDLVVLPSLCEGSPNVILEAYMLGRPVIATNIEAERGLVDERFLYDVGDDEGLSDSIKKLMSLSSDEYLKLISDNRRRVTDEYSFQHMVKKMSKMMGH